MFPGITVIPPPPTSMRDVIQSLGLGTSLKLCLDAGDIGSYDGSSQTWTDQSGGGYSFFRGSGSGSDAADPTFNGTAGRQSIGEYFSYDGADWFTLNQSNPSWVTAIHKDNAVLTILEWVYANNITNGATQFFGDLGTSDNSGAGAGFLFGNSSVGDGRHLTFAVSNGASTAMGTSSVTVEADNNAWNMIGVSFTESTGALTFLANGVYEAQTGKTYSSPSSGAAQDTLQVGAVGSGHFAETSGNRVAGVMMFDAALSQAQLTSIYDATKGRFGR